ncbi:MAG: M1 family aminopeptidase, partial [Gammaproteobacteria bacterium]
MAVTSLIAGAEAVAPVRTGFGLACLLWLSPAAAEVQHALDVTLDAEHGHIEVTDSITLADNGAAQSGFVLHPALSPQVLTPGVRLIAGDGSTANAEKATKPDSPSAKLEPLSYRVLLPAGRRSFTLHYQGDIHHAPQQGGPDYTRGFSETPGLITKQGAFLSGSSFWYPQFADELQTFELTLHLPRGWYGMSQGERLGREVVAQHVTERWRSAQPQQEIYLIAGPFTEYTSAAGPVQAMVLLRQPDAALARKYLDATARYIRLYSDLIGPYPYGKFALVENFWETGYGMPSFTLLGSKVIRFPFILYSSYPHEILHNWWGNGVYVDYAHGNWSEGLTSYLADHLIKEQRGQAVDYRRSTLQKYTDHVRGQQDFPLTQFRSRHSAVTEAVGYGKTLMLFHMLRRELGDETFIRALRVLYRDNLFKVAGYAQVEGAFSEAAQRPLGDFFAQWTQRSGAPQLRVSQAQARARDADFVLSAVIEQVQDEAPYTLEVPLAIGLEGREQGWQTRVRLEGRRTTLELVLPARPLQLKVDPEFDVFRRLDRAEIPPAISQALGDERLLIVLPDAAPEELRQAYEAVAKTWQAGQNGRIEVVGDSTLDVLPGDRSVWLFGWQNRFRHQLADAMEGYDYHDRGATVQIAGGALNEREHAVVVMGRRAADSAHALGWLATARVAALP